LIHTDYQDNGGIVIEKYHDRFEFSNPGLLLISFEQLLIGNINNSISKYVVSGQANTRSDHIQNGQVLYNNIQHISPNISVSPVYTGSLGLIGDSILSFAQRMEFYKPKRLDHLESYVKSTVKNLGNND
jgi:hypothetical protein